MPGPTPPPPGLDRWLTSGETVPSYEEWQRSRDQMTTTSLAHQLHLANDILNLRNNRLLPLLSLSRIHLPPGGATETFGFAPAAGTLRIKDGDRVVAEIPAANRAVHRHLGMVIRRVDPVGPNARVEISAEAGPSGARRLEIGDGGTSTPINFQIQERVNTAAESLYELRQTITTPALDCTTLSKTPPNRTSDWERRARHTLYIERARELGLRLTTDQYHEIDIVDYLQTSREFIAEYNAYTAGVPATAPRDEAEPARYRRVFKQENEASVNALIADIGVLRNGAEAQTWAHEASRALMERPGQVPAAPPGAITEKVTSVLTWLRDANNDDPPLEADLRRDWDSFVRERNAFTVATHTTSGRLNARGHQFRVALEDFRARLGQSMHKITQRKAHLDPGAVRSAFAIVGRDENVRIHLAPPVAPRAGVQRSTLAHALRTGMFIQRHRTICEEGRIAVAARDQDAASSKIRESDALRRSFFAYDASSQMRRVLINELLTNRQRLNEVPTPPHWEGPIAALAQSRDADFLRAFGEWVAAPADADKAAAAVTQANRVLGALRPPLPNTIVTVATLRGIAESAKPGHLGIGGQPGPRAAPGARSVAARGERRQRRHARHAVQPRAPGPDAPARRRRHGRQPRLDHRALRRRLHRLRAPRLGGPVVQPRRRRLDRQ